MPGQVGSYVTASYAPGESGIDAARGMVSDSLRSWQADTLVPEAIRLTEEILRSLAETVTGHLEVSCRRLDAAVHIEVSDVDPVRPGASPDVLPLRSASACGIAYHGPTRTVWFRLDFAGAGHTATATEDLPGLDSTAKASPQGWLGFLADASALLAGTLDQDMIPAIVAQIVVPRLATWCAVHTRETDGGLRLAYVWHANETHLDALREQLARSPLPAEKADPVLLRDSAGRVTLHLPLTARRRSLGVLTLGRPDRFPDETAQIAEDLANRAALALDNARLYAQQASTARALQRSLLPPEVPQVAGVDHSVVYEAAGESNDVGGDFYDLFACPGDRWRFAIGDVCGTGPEAASVTGLARQTLRLLAREGYSVADVVARLNAAIIDQGPRARFLTLLYGEIVRRENGLRLTMVCAGHPPPLLHASGGVVRPVCASQSLLGVFPEVTFFEEAVDLDRDEVLLAVTDGVTERRNGTRLLDDDDGLMKLFAECAGLSAAAVAGRIRRAVQEFADQPPKDDLAILALRAL